MCVYDSKPFLIRGGHKTASKTCIEATPWPIESQSRKIPVYHLKWTWNTACIKSKLHHGSPAPKNRHWFNMVCKAFKKCLKVFKHVKHNLVPLQNSRKWFFLVWLAALKHGSLFIVSLFESPDRHTHTKSNFPGKYVAIQTSSYQGCYWKNDYWCYW